jgi:hypothetical protein
MALAPFFERIYGALGGHLTVSRETLNKALDEVVVGIHCGRQLTDNERWISELCVNLSSRLYPRLVVRGADDHCETLGKLARSINPSIELCESAVEAATICVGSTSAPNALYPSARGWLARLSHEPSERGRLVNPYAAGAAAALACAEMFRRIFNKVPPERDLSISLLNYDTNCGGDLSLSKRNIGEVVFAGIGAVGNAALWAMARDQKTFGTAFLVDPESVELSNLQRYVLAHMSNIGTHKVDLGHSALSDTHWKVETRQVTLEQFAPEFLERRIPYVAVSVDSVESRRTAQALLPRLVVNGWTGGDALGASWHVFARDAACLACLYHPHGKGKSAVEQASQALGLSHDRTALLWVTHQPLTETDIHAAALALGVKDSVLMPWRRRTLGELYSDVVCGAVPMDVAGVGKVEMVPLAHQSALAGIMMAAELLKRTNRRLSTLSQPETLVSWDNILQSVPALWCKPRSREPGCICGDRDYQSVYEQKWGTGAAKL